MSTKFVPFFLTQGIVTSSFRLQVPKRLSLTTPLVPVPVSFVGWVLHTFISKNRARCYTGKKDWLQNAFQLFNKTCDDLCMSHYYSECRDFISNHECWPIGKSRCYVCWMSVYKVLRLKSYFGIKHLRAKLMSKTLVININIDIVMKSMGSSSPLHTNCYF